MQSLLVYGPTSSGKTSLCGQFARYQYHRHGNRPCLYVGSDSGWESAIDEVRDTVMLPYNVASHPNPGWAIRRLARGFWPTKVDSYGTAVDPGDFRTLKDLALEISGIAVEGITRFNEILSGNMTNDLQLDTQEPLSAKFRLKSDGTVVQGPALLAAENPDEESFSMASRGTYKFIQEQTLDYVNRFKSHPYAPRLLMTAHSGEGQTSDGISSRCLGPIVYGKKLVDKAPGWFSSYFHAETIPANSFSPGSPEMRALWFRFHPDTTGLQWPAKLGASPSMTEWFRQTYPNGYLPAWIEHGRIQGGLITFLQAFDQAY